MMNSYLTPEQKKELEDNRKEIKRKSKLYDKLRDLKLKLASGLKGEEYKKVMKEYIKTKEALK